jgi:hypothetical protein
MPGTVDLRGKAGSLGPCLNPDVDGLLLKAKALSEVCHSSRRPAGDPSSRAPPAHLQQQRRPRFTACTLDDAGASLALASDAGQVFVLQLEAHRRRFIQLDPLGTPGAAAAWAAARGARRLLFVAERAGGAVRCYDLATRAFATLPGGGRANTRSLSVGAGGGQLAAAAADGVAVWRLAALERRSLLSAAPYGILQVRAAPPLRGAGQLLLSPAWFRAVAGGSGIKDWCS